MYYFKLKMPSTTATTVRNEFRLRTVPLVSTNESSIISNYGSINRVNKPINESIKENDYFNFNRRTKKRHVQRLLTNNIRYNYLQENSNAPLSKLFEKTPTRSQSMSFFNSKLVLLFMILIYFKIV